MDKLKALLTEAETIAISELQAQTKTSTPSPHAAILRVRIHAALESLEAHVKHVAANPVPKTAAK